MHEGEVMVTVLTALSMADQVYPEDHHLMEVVQTKDTKVATVVTTQVEEVQDWEARTDPAVTTTFTDLIDQETAVARRETTGEDLLSEEVETTRMIVAGAWTTTETRKVIPSREETAKLCSDTETLTKARKRSTAGPRTTRGTEGDPCSGEETAAHSTATTTTLTDHRTDGKTTRSAGTDLFPAEKARSMAGLVMMTVLLEEEARLSMAMMHLAGEVLAVAAAVTVPSNPSS